LRGLAGDAVIARGKADDHAGLVVLLSKDDQRALPPASPD